VANGWGDELDPQRNYLAIGGNILRLTTRTLTTYRSEPGVSSEIVPDLATDTGRPTENNTIWRFTLKPNVKWEGGELVTCSQVKYGIERRFATDYAVHGKNPDGSDAVSFPFTEGPTYPMDFLADNALPLDFG